MREVDEALARAYSLHDTSNAPREMPPAPHWQAHRLHPDPSQESFPALAPLPPSFEPVVELQWPAVVLSLERTWGDRFERLAELLIQLRMRQNVRAVLFTSCHRA